LNFATVEFSGVTLGGYKGSVHARTFDIDPAPVHFVVNVNQFKHEILRLVVDGPIADQ
jgi:hypothetical protein